MIMLLKSLSVLSPALRRPIGLLVSMREFKKKMQNLPRKHLMKKRRYNVKMILTLTILILVNTACISRPVAPKQVKPVMPPNLQKPTPNLIQEFDSLFCISVPSLETCNQTSTTAKPD